MFAMNKHKTNIVFKLKLLTEFFNKVKIFISIIKVNFVALKQTVHIFYNFIFCHGCFTNKLLTWLLGNPLYSKFLQKFINVVFQR